MDYLTFYDLETYLFDQVAPRHQQSGQLQLFDLISIAEWKAPRARTHVLRRIKKIGEGSLERGALRFAAAVSYERSAADRFAAVFGDFGFALPMASAFLTVLDRNEFTVYDRRVCDQLG